MTKGATNLHVPDADSLQISSGNKSVSYEAQTANHTYVLLENVKQNTYAKIKGGVFFFFLIKNQSTGRRQTS